MMASCFNVFVGYYMGFDKKKMTWSQACCGIGMPPMIRSYSSSWKSSWFLVATRLDRLRTGLLRVFLLTGCWVIHSRKQTTDQASHLLNHLERGYLVGSKTLETPECFATTRTRVKASKPLQYVRLKLPNFLSTSWKQIGLVWDNPFWVLERCICFC